MTSNWARVAYEFHGECVDEEVAGVDVGIFGADGFETRCQRSPA